jgi:hypothetical protein
MTRQVPRRGHSHSHGRSTWEIRGKRMSEELQLALSGDEQNALEVYEQTIARGL